jgi:hypothetical protein
MPFAFRQEIGKLPGAAFEVFRRNARQGFNRRGNEMNSPALIRRATKGNARKIG